MAKRTETTALELLSQWNNNDNQTRRGVLQLIRLCRLNNRPIHPLNAVITILNKSHTIHGGESKSLTKHKKMKLNEALEVAEMLLKDADQYDPELHRHVFELITLSYNNNAPMKPLNAIIAVLNRNISPVIARQLSEEHQWIVSDRTQEDLDITFKAVIKFAKEKLGSTFDSASFSDVLNAYITYLEEHYDSLIVQKLKTEAEYYKDELEKRFLQLSSK